MHHKILSETPDGGSARITSLEANGSERRRLLDLGFTPGASVTCLYSAPSGSPRAYLIRGSVIALRTSDARRVRISAEG